MRKKICNGAVSSFGAQRCPLLPRTVLFHTGVDILAPIGTPILSPIDGVIMAAYHHPRSGNVLIIADNTGKMRLGFCHLQSLGLARQTVKKGEIIANLGMSGNISTPRLRFTLKKGGKWNADNKYVGGDYVDPTPLIEF